jgi:hypothetical protein
MRGGSHYSSWDNMVMGRSLGRRGEERIDKGEKEKIERRKGVVVFGLSTCSSRDAALTELRLIESAQVQHPWE